MKRKATKGTVIDRRRRATAATRPASSGPAPSYTVSPRLSVVYTKLLATDIAEVKARAKRESIPWQTLLRSLLHSALNARIAFKFMILPGEANYRTLPAELSPLGADGKPITVQYADRLAVQIASSQEEAVAALRQRAAEQGWDARWLAVADVVPIPLDSRRPQFITWVQH